VSYRENIGWQKSMLLVIDVYQFTDTLPNAEKYGILQQIQKSAVSIPSNIAEGYGRSTKVDYARFVDIALGSTRELQTQLEICERLGYGMTKELVDRGEEVAKIPYGLAKSLRK
jgi:four helix bundle protein